MSFQELFSIRNSASESQLLVGYSLHVVLFGNGKQLNSTTSKEFRSHKNIT